MRIQVSYGTDTEITLIDGDERLTVRLDGDDSQRPFSVLLNDRELMRADADEIRRVAALLRELAS